MAKSILMICSAYPPSGGAGMLRPAKFAKFLPEYGWCPTVLTPRGDSGKIPCSGELGEAPGVRVVRTPTTAIVEAIRSRLGLKRRASGASNSRAIAPELVKRGERRPGILRRTIYEAITIPDDSIGWYQHAVRAGRELLGETPYECIYSTSPAETSHLVARRLKREFGVPWVAELRDPWSFDHFRAYSAWKRVLLRMLERSVLRDADHLVTVSDLWRDTFVRHFHRQADTVHCIPHGFDPDDYPEATSRPDRFTLSYTGSLHAEKQDPTPLLAAVADLLRQGGMDRRRVRLQFYAYGDQVPDFHRLAQRYNLAGVLTAPPLLPYRECLAAQRASTGLLVFQWTGQVAKGIQYIKSIEYLGARRPILLIGSGEGAAGDLLRLTRAGAIGQTVEQLKNILLGWYEEYRLSGSVMFRGDEAVVASYTRRNQTGKLAAICDGLCRLSTIPHPGVAVTAPSSQQDD